MPGRTWMGIQWEPALVICRLYGHLALARSGAGDRRVWWVASSFCAVTCLYPHHRVRGLNQACLSCNQAWLSGNPLTSPHNISHPSFCAVSCPSSHCCCLPLHSWLLPAPPLIAVACPSPHSVLGLAFLQPQERSHPSAGGRGRLVPPVPSGAAAQSVALPLPALQL